MEKILIVEDDRSLYKALKLAFEADGYAIEFASDGEAGLQAFRNSPPAIVVLDLKLPKMHGREVCRTIRAEAPNLPVIVLSASADEVDKVLLLEMGADDYITKPFSPKELLARVHSVSRRVRGPKPIDQYAFDDVSVDFAKMELTRAGEKIPLTPQEFKILKYFVRNPERVISRDELLNQVWGYDCYPSTRTVDNHIMKLRQKLETAPMNPTHFITIHGAGYKFVP
ncbi:MAG TPA: response regulator transcription factor [Terriglobia bacterium]|nr:response regulator transcription factor [Terriglobia bacterium]